MHKSHKIHCITGSSSTYTIFKKHNLMLSFYFNLQFESASTLQIPIRLIAKRCLMWTFLNLLAVNCIVIIRLDAIAGETAQVNGRTQRTHIQNCHCKFGGINKVLWNTIDDIKRKAVRLIPYHLHLLIPSVMLCWRCPRTGSSEAFLCQPHQPQQALTGMHVRWFNIMATVIASN